jgi:hypothetical protein
MRTAGAHSQHACRAPSGGRRCGCRSSPLCAPHLDDPLIGLSIAEGYRPRSDETRIAESDQYHPRPPGALSAPIMRYARAVLTHEQIQNARKRATQLLEDAGFVLTELERDSIEAADFGLSELEQTGWRSSCTSIRSVSAPRRS